MRTIYLAGRFSRRDEFNGYAVRLRSWGFTVDARWLVEDHEWYGEQDAGAREAARRFALDDLEDVTRADIVLVFTGRHVEYGIALGQGKDIVVVGEPENVFHNLTGSVPMPDGTVHGTTARVKHAATFDDVPDRLREWLYPVAEPVR
jgi:nucleoside 2-deoxyribosyltransferase